MKTYETPEGVDEYFKMSNGYDLSRFKDLILKYLPKGKSLLEIGMGPGNDFLWLSQLFKVTGSDYSEEFIIRAKNRFSDADLIILDAVSLEIESIYDAIFSSKVYQHFSLEQLEIAFKNQYNRLSENGLFIHSFWIGGMERDFDDMHFVYHVKEELLNLIKDNFEVLETDNYAEFEENDSLFVIARRI